jgi:hypothetical protein
MPAEYQPIEIQAAIKRSNESVKDTQFFTIAGTQCVWGDARQQCLNVGADAAIVLHSDEEKKIRAFCEADQCLLGMTHTHALTFLGATCNQQYTV